MGRVGYDFSGALKWNAVIYKFSTERVSNVNDALCPGYTVLILRSFSLFILARATSKSSMIEFSCGESDLSGFKIKSPPIRSPLGVRIPIDPFE